MFLHHSLLYSLARGLPGLLNLAAIVLYTRLVAPDTYGLYALVIAGVYLGNKLIFEWLRLALLRFRPALQDRRTGLQATISAGFLGLVAATALLGAAALLLPTDGTTRWLLAAGLLLLWAQALFDLQLERVRSDLQPKQYGMLSLTRAALALVFGSTFVLLGLGALGLVFGLTLGTLIAGGRLLVEEIREFQLGRCDWALMGALARYGAPLAVTAALSFIIAGSDRFLIAWLLDTEAAGQYAAGYDLATLPIGLLMMIINLAAYPLVVRALEEDGPEVARRQLAVCLTALLGIGLPATLGIAILARPIAEVLLGASFRDAGALLIPWVAFAALARDVKAYYLDLAFQLGRNTLGQMWITVAAAVVNLVLNLWWIPIFGIVGAAWATVAAYGVAFVLSAGLGWRSFALPRPGRDSLKVAIAALGMGLVLWPLAAPGGLLLLLGQVLAGVAAFGGLAWLLDLAGVRTRGPALFRLLRPAAPGR